MSTDWQEKVQQEPFLAEKEHFVTHLLAWFEAHGRDLPWRQTRDPYAILVSELMLQQTQVSRILEYYPRFLAQFPDFASLANATEEEVVAAWEGLGYYNRARNFRKLAIEITEKFGGIFPQEKDTIEALPGIGKYTAGAVQTFALGIRAPIVDTNVNRVLSRVFLTAKEASQAKNAMEKIMWVLSEALLPEDRFWDFNQGIMDFGAMQCMPKPRCNTCPMKPICRYYKRNSLLRFVKQ
jgi:A/G-specific adenine glycosylase